MKRSKTADTRWFEEARYGLFIHWGPYAAIGRGEQVLFREQLDQKVYAREACQWNPSRFDAEKWAALAVRGGFRYAVLTARHHDGYCLWDSALTDYSSSRQAPGRDFVREFLDAFRRAGLRVGLYYSLADWRVPAYWEGPRDDPRGWSRFRAYVHGQVDELLTRYGPLDLFWFDGPWPHRAADWQSRKLVAAMKRRQPWLLINNRLDRSAQEGGTGAARRLGDFGTPEHEILPEAGRPWESCQVTAWRHWGYAEGERYRSAAQLLDLLCEAASKGGNLLLNVGPDAEGEIPPQPARALAAVGRWLGKYGAAIYGTRRGDLTEFVTCGYQVRGEKALYLIFRFWPRNGSARVAGLRAPGARAVLLGAPRRSLGLRETPGGLLIAGLPAKPPGPLFPVIRLDLAGEPERLPWARERLWQGDPRRMTAWSLTRGLSVWADGRERPDPFQKNR
ncbi:MAG TPA: alpha-L-fucosidase [Chthoniobacteraceae bacterium]|nr:alpha-L-fucosidase [Chthoniobacteraceae bacterium]